MNMWRVPVRVSNTTSGVSTPVKGDAGERTAAVCVSDHGPAIDGASQRYTSTGPVKALFAVAKNTTLSLMRTILLGSFHIATSQP